MVVHFALCRRAFAEQIASTQEIEGVLARRMSIFGAEAPIIGSAFSL